jgi:hypothetical protein
VTKIGNVKAQLLSQYIPPVKLPSAFDERRYNPSLHQIN